MPLIQEEYSDLRHYASLPAFTWKVILRTDFGARYFNRTYIGGVLLPICVLFAPFPFTGKYLWTDAPALKIYCIIAAVLGVYEWLRFKFNKQRKDIHSHSIGSRNRKIFNKVLSLIANVRNRGILGETALALILAYFCYVTGYDKFFAKIMVYIAVFHCWEQLEFRKKGIADLMDAKDGIIQAGQQQKVYEKADEDLNSGQGAKSSGENGEGFIVQ